MPSGFGTIDYVVFAAILVYVTLTLLSSPARLLYGLPLLLTVYFIVPLGTLLRPAQAVPLILAVWMLGTGGLAVPARYREALVVFAAVVAVALAAGLLWGDAGGRPIFRAAHYASLVFIVLFVTMVTRGEREVRMAVIGLFICGAVHATYGIYQIIAVETGLPFRAIVRGTSGGYSWGWAGGILRINGLASEPKRLSYILLVGSLAAVALAQMAGKKQPRPGYLAAAAVLFVLSFLSFSGSYVAALLVAAVLVAFTIPRTVRLAPIAFLGGALLYGMFPDLTSNLVGVLVESLASRQAEVEAGLESEFVYRQEFYAQAYAEENPLSLLFGVGLGRYNAVLHDRFGQGVGYDGGVILPINSQFFEVGFDLGAAGLVLLYVGGIAVARRLRNDDPVGMMLKISLIFLLVQSLLVEDLYFGAFVLGLAMAFLEVRRRGTIMEFARRSRARPVFDPGASPTTKRGDGLAPRPR